jgi:hypothetical protein
MAADVLGAQPRDEIGAGTRRGRHHKLDGPAALRPRRKSGQRQHHERNSGSANSHRTILDWWCKRAPDR